MEVIRSHRELAAGQWSKLSLAEQLANVGSEVGRMVRWRDRDARLMNGAFDRALELLDLTLADPRWRNRLSEISRARELLCAAVLDGGGGIQDQPRGSGSILPRFRGGGEECAGSFSRLSAPRPSPYPLPRGGRGLRQGGEGEVDLGGLELWRQEEDG